jgi:hypothetical protein
VKRWRLHDYPGLARSSVLTHTNAIYSPPGVDGPYGPPDVLHLEVQCKVIDYTKDDFATHGHRYDLILAANGNRSIWDYRRALTADGCYAMTGGSNRQLTEDAVARTTAFDRESTVRKRISEAQPSRPPGSEGNSAKLET